MPICRNSLTTASPTPEETEATWKHVVAVCFFVYTIAHTTAPPQDPKIQEFIKQTFEKEISRKKRRHHKTKIRTPHTHQARLTTRNNTKLFKTYLDPNRGATYTLHTHNTKKTVRYKKRPQYIHSLKRGHTIFDGCMIVVGTRPEIVKMAPLVRALKENSLPYLLVHCGQHYDYEMSQQFIEELELPKPDYGFEVKVHSPGRQTGRILCLIEKVVKKTEPRLVLVEGDTNGVLASALVTIKLNIPVGHIEAGLRSFDLRMPEEYNRRLVDHISTYLFAPTENSKKNLENESVWGKIYVTGNTVIDAINQHLPIASRGSKILNKIRFDEFALVTAHRAENVDDPKALKNFIQAFVEAPIPIVYPIHPRTRKRLHQQKMWNLLSSSENVEILPPLGYFDFLILMKNCEMILTDSGGIQEEATAPQMRKPVLVLRLSTERPEAVEAGFAKVVGVEKERILKEMKSALNQEWELPQSSPYGDGTAGKKIVEILINEIYNLWSAT